MEMSTLVHAFRRGEVLAPNGQVVAVQKALLTRRSLILMSEKTVLKFRRPRDVAGFDQNRRSIRHGMTARERWVGMQVAPDTYLEELTLLNDTEGPLRLVNGRAEGEAVLAMRRWPEAHAASELVFDGKHRPELFSGVMRKLATFHLDALAHREGPFAEVEHLQQKVRSWVSRVEAASLEMSVTQWTAFKESLLDGASSSRTTLEHRILEGRVRECHGGVYLEHIFIDPENPEHVAILDPEDGLDEARVMDVGEELMRFALELELARGAAFADKVIEAYVTQTQDHTLRKVRHLFRGLALLHTVAQACEEASDPEGAPQARQRAEALLSWACADARA